MRKKQGGRRRAQITISGTISPAPKRWSRMGVFEAEKTFFRTKRCVRDDNMRHMKHHAVTSASITVHKTLRRQRRRRLFDGDRAVCTHEPPRAPGDEGSRREGVGPDSVKREFERRGWKLQSERAAMVPSPARPLSGEPEAPSRGAGGQLWAAGASGRGGSGERRNGNAREGTRADPGDRPSADGGTGGQSAPWAPQTAPTQDGFHASRFRELELPAREEALRRGAATSRSRANISYNSRDRKHSIGAHIVAQ